LTAGLPGLRKQPEGLVISGKPYYASQKNASTLVAPYDLSDTCPAADQISKASMIP
jgi:hypothetical protein